MTTPSEIELARPALTDRKMEVTCPCGCRFHVERTRAGERIRCVGCKKTFRVPHPSGDELQPMRLTTTSRRRGAALGSIVAVEAEPAGSPGDSQPVLEAVEAGQVVDGRYRIDAAVGLGGMANAYLATDLRVDRRVVLKVPHRDLLLKPGFEERFLREVESLTRLDHPHIVKILDVGSWDGVPVAVLQYLPGGSLQTRLRNLGRRVNYEELKSWLPGIGEALDYIHARGLVHRDLTPANILFDEHGHAYLADFGIVRAIDPPKDAAPLTRTDFVPGAYPYMPPEALVGKYGPAYDQYSLAVIVFRALSGRLPHGGETPLSMLMNKTSKPPVALGSLAPEVPRRIADAVHRGLSAQPADRFASCVEFARTVQDGAEEDLSPGESFLVTLASEARERTGTGPRGAPSQATYVPSRAEAQFATVALARGAIDSTLLVLALNLQERRHQAGERVGLQAVLLEQGLIDRPAIAALEQEAARKVGRERDEFFARTLVDRRLLTAAVAEAERESHRALAEEVPLDEHLAGRGVLNAYARDQVQLAWLRRQFLEEDRLLTEIAFRAGYLTREEIQNLITRQKRLAATGRAPLPVHSVLSSASPEWKALADAILRAVRRHVMTGRPIADFLPRRPAVARA